MRRESKAADRSVEAKADCVTEKDKLCPNRADTRTNSHKYVKTTSIMDTSLAEPRLLGRGEGLVKCLYATCSPLQECLQTNQIAGF